MVKSNVKKNALVSFGGQLVIIILGFVIPRIFISKYGSDVNGLLSTLSQIFTYLALLEAGISQAARNALYKPLHDNAMEDISIVSSVAKSYYRKISPYYAAGVLLISIIAPLVIKTSVDTKTVFLVVLLEGMSGACSFYFIQTYYVILQADGHGFINDSINLFYRVFSYIARIVLALNRVNIIFLQACYLFLTIIKVVAYKLYFKKSYPWIDLNKDTKGKKLPDRNSYIIIEIAWTIFSSTDLIILSTFLSTSASSIYAVYNMVFVGLHSILNAVYHSTSYILGMKYHENIEAYEKTHDLYMSLFLGMMTILMSTTIYLMTPFIQLYTRNVSDINYIINGLPVLFCLVQIFSWSRYIQGNLMGISGYAKQAGKISIVEAVANVTFSVILVGKYGISGVLFATVIALPIKIIYTTYVSDKLVMKRSFRHSITIIGSNLMFFFVNVNISKYGLIEIGSYHDFIIKGMLTFVIVSILGIGVNILANPSFVKSILGMMQSQKLNKN